MSRDDAFRASERARCREVMRRCRSGRKQARADQAATLLPLPSAEELLTGLISHLADTTDPHVVAHVMSRYAERGRRLAVVHRNRGSP